MNKVGVVTGYTGFAIALFTRIATVNKHYQEQHIAVLMVDLYYYSPGA